MQPDLVDQVLFDEEFDTEVQRKRTTSVSKMDRKDSAAPEEEEEEERPPIVNGLAGERHYCNFSYSSNPADSSSDCFLCSFFSFFLFCPPLHYIFLKMQNSSAFLSFFPLLSSCSPNILRISCSAGKVSAKSQPCKVEQ